MLKQIGVYLTLLGIGISSCPVLASPMTPRQAFYYHAHQGNLTALIQLKKMGYLIDVSDDYGNSALCEAVIKKDTRAVQVLVQAGADTNATCMQALSVDVKQTPVNSAPVISGEVNQKEKLASPAATKIPNPPAEPLSKNTKVGIGLGVATLAAAGTTVAILASSGGGSSTPLKCVDGVQKGKRCQCNPHAIGTLCDSCEEGYGMYGTNSCHETKVCKTNAEQIGENCQCKKGFDFEGNTSCYPNLKCSSLFAHMHQDLETGSCTCDAGFDEYKEDGYAVSGCYKNQGCNSSNHLTQANNSCVCMSGYPVPHIQGDVLVSCSSCGVEGATWDGGKCHCPANAPVAEYKSDGITLAHCYSCSKYVSGSTWNGTQCMCPASTPKAIAWDDFHIPTECRACPSGATYVKSKNMCDCGTDKIDVGNACVKDLHCSDQPNSTGNQESATKCECKVGYSGSLCTECAAGYTQIANGSCVKTVKAGNSAVNNENIEYTVENNETIVGFTSSMIDIENVNAEGNSGEKDKKTVAISLNNTGEGDVYGMYSKRIAIGAFTNKGDKGYVCSKIEIENSGTTAYGIYAEGDAIAVENLAPGRKPNIFIESQITMKDKAGGTLYGVYSLDGDAYGVLDYGTATGYKNQKRTKSTITLENKGGTSYGIYSENGDAWGGFDSAHTNKRQPEKSYSQRALNTILNLWQWGGTAYGIVGNNAYSSDVGTSGGSTAGNYENIINMWLFGEKSGELDVANGKVIGMRAISNEGTILNDRLDQINIYSFGNSYKVGDETITKASQDKTQNIGIFADPGVSVTNSGTISIKREWTDDNGTSTNKDDIPYTSLSTGGNAYGIYVKGGGSSPITITNKGTIEIMGNWNNAYGIYIENGQNVNVINEAKAIINVPNGYGIYFKVGNGGSVTNSGTIIASGTSSNGCVGEACYHVPSAISYDKDVSQGEPVDPEDDDDECEGEGCPGWEPPEDEDEDEDDDSENEEPLLNTLATASLNLDSIGATVIAKKSSVFGADNSILGLLHIDPDTVTGGFESIYTEKDMIQAGDVSGLKLVSDSALFDAKLADNGSDVVMTMKGFDTTTTNKSLADFLGKNYALGNNEAFFNKLKSFGNMSALTDSLNKLTGKDILSRFNFEDMTMMRELNFDMNEKLFHNKEQHFALAGSVSPMAFRGDTGSNARYSLYNKRDGNKSIGLGIAFTNMRSDDSHDKDDRRETSYQLILPMGYKTHGFNLVTSPRIGYARGTYDRTGFDDQSYDGTIEKRVFGLMNEARYPITVGKWKLEPSAEFNILGYQQKGHEDAKEFALNIQNQNTYSVEGGIGLYATREEELDKDSTLKLTAGVAVYHEFADPYKLRVGMNGMDGAFTLRDENRSDNRGVIRAGFDYVYRDLSLYGSLISYIDREARTSAKTGMKVAF